MEKEALKFIEHEHPEFGYYLVPGYGAEYMGVWRIRINSFKTCTSSNLGGQYIKWRLTPSRVSFEKLELVWYVNEQNKPTKPDHEPKIVSVGRHQVAFTFEELEEHFDRAIEKYIKEDRASLVRTASEIDFYLSKIKELTQNITYCQAQIAMALALDLPNFEQEAANGQSEAVRGGVAGGDRPVPDDSSTEAS